SVAFNVQPRANGQVLVGSTRQFGREDAEVEEGIMGRMMARAREFMPGLAELAIVRAWTGLRPATPDKLPLIGPSLSDERVIIAAGHEGLGITTAPGTGRLVADRVLGRASAIDPTPY